MKVAVLLIALVACAIGVNGHAYLVSPSPRVTVTWPGDKTGEPDSPPKWTVYNQNLPTCGGELSGTAKNRGVWSTNQPIQVKWALSIPHPSSPGVEVYLKCGTGTTFGVNNRKATGVDVGTTQDGMYSVNITSATACDPGVILWSWRSSDDGGYYMDCADVRIIDTAGQKGLTLPEPPYPATPSSSTPSPSTPGQTPTDPGSGGDTDPATGKPAPSAADVAIKVTLNQALDEISDEEQFELDLATDFATVLGIDALRITIVSVTAVGAKTDVVFTINNNSKLYTLLSVAKARKTMQNYQGYSSTTALAEVDVTTVVDYTAQTNAGKTPGPTSDSSNNTGVIVGVVVGVAVLAVVAGAVYWFKCRNAKQPASGGNFSDVGVKTSAPMSPPPSAAGWTKVWDDNTKHFYYFNTNTSESSWTAPAGCEHL